VFQKLVSEGVHKNFLALFLQSVKNAIIPAQAGNQTIDVSLWIPAGACPRLDRGGNDEVFANL
jgi:hypothetical protein